MSAPPGATPRRLQLSRRKGFNLQSHSRAVNGLEARKVDRTTVFGNPAIVGPDCTAADCAAWFRDMFTAEGPRCYGARQFEWREHVRKRLPELRGKNLACWCKPGDPCHADVLLEIANR